MERKQHLLRSALFYAEKMGWPVFPCKPRGKEPLVPHGCKEATTDPVQVKKWWTKWPNANIGIATGIAFFVLDRDPRNGGDESFMALIAKHTGLPDTIAALTGGGGSHTLFEIPSAGPVIRNGVLAPGIDIKGKGGYILVAPSIHPNGKAYVWDGAKPITEQVIQPAPPWLLGAIYTSQNGHSGEPLKVPKQIKKGLQHQTLFKLGASMRAKGLEEPEIFAALWEVNQNRCEEPGPRENIEKLAASICLQYEAGSSAKKPIPEPPEGQDAPMPDEAATNHRPPPKAAPAAFTSQECLTIYHADYPEPEPIIDAILYPGLTILGGRPKVGKSWLALQLAIAVVSGNDFGGYLAVKKPGRCLFLSLEERPRQTHSRLHMLTQPADCLADLWFAYDLIPLMAGGAAVLDQHLTAHPVEVMIVDSLLAVTKQAGRKGVDILQTDYNIVNTLRNVAEKHGIAMVLIAHTRKAAGDFLDSIQGTTGTTAAADAVWVLGRTPEGDATLSVTGREIRSNVFGLKRESDEQPAWTIVGEGDEISQSEARREIIELLRDQGPMKLTSIARAVHKNVGGVQRLLRKLCEAALIVRTHHGTYQILGEDRASRSSK